MSSKSSTIPFNFSMPVTDFSKKTETGFPHKGDLNVHGNIVILENTSDAEEKVSAKLSSIIWQDVNILPLVKANHSLRQFHSELIDIAVNVHTKSSSLILKNA